MIAAHMCLSLGGVLLHSKFHPVTQSLYFWWAASADAFSLVVLPWLFAKRSTVGWAYLLNAITVLTGVVAMAFFSILRLPDEVSLSAIVLETTFPYIIILLAKLPIAHAVLLSWRPDGVQASGRGCRE
jgi:hypothetical protein